MCGQFEHIQQGRMSVIEYNMRFTKLSRHATFLIPIEIKKARRFIERLNFGMKIIIDREAETGTTFLQAVLS